ncbi:LacI family DNA-binding transcriptional regulator [Coraliomargarita parva]|uniref:LacI family DNA-binding transcriptional regulator n=1 Tax=Coraliomargarita parva TaxID=3014050 RepID=UPI0022B31FDD|nr:LacI family DNA-binding transcriptional regulator [Coraliomargarita parva]
MKDVATAAGVSSSTVCRALNSNPQIPEATRKRIQKVAEELGYRPDPLLSAFASRRRGRKLGSSVTTIAYITNFATRDEWRENPFYKRCYEGIRERVESLGYKLEHFWLGETGMNAQRLSRILYNRGILGICVAPMAHVREPIAIEWERFSCVTIGYSVMTPILHRSTPHHYHGMQLAIRQLYDLGYDRIGLCLFSDTSRRVDELWLSAAFLAQNGRLVLKGVEARDFAIKTYLFDDNTLADVPDWCRREKLDVVISDNRIVAQTMRNAGISVPGEVDIATLNWNEANGGVAGINQRPDKIGAAAMDMLIGQMQRGERGIPDVPLTTMVEGVWVDGKSLSLVDRT